MKSIQRFSFLVFSIILLNLITACGDDDSHHDPETHDCSFVQNDDDMDGLIDDNEKAIMEDCNNNKLTDKDEVISNLIGEWNIVGHGEGWVPSISQPCGKVVFTESEFTLDFHSFSIDTTYVGNWAIIETESGGIFFENIGDPVYQMNMNTFCDDYMYFDHTPLDGNMYLYEKMK